VCLPDFQGVGIGNALSELVAAMYSNLKGYRSVTSHPAMIRHRLRSPLWHCSRKPCFNRIAREKKGRKRNGVNKTTSVHRYTAGFEFIGPSRRVEAQALGVI
jgi:hypothetical protein